MVKAYRNGWECDLSSREARLCGSLFMSNLCINKSRARLSREQTQIVEREQLALVLLVYSKPPRPGNVGVGL